MQRVLYNWRGVSTDGSGEDLLPIQEAARRFSVSVASLYKYAALGQIKKYRRAFDRVTYVNGQQIAQLAAPATTSDFVADIPLARSDDLLQLFLRRLQERFPQRHWSLAGWGRFAIVNGRRERPYVALKYAAHHQRSVLPELKQVMDELDPTRQKIDRDGISLGEYPFSHKKA